VSRVETPDLEGLVLAKMKQSGGISTVTEVVQVLSEAGLSEDVVRAAVLGLLAKKQLLLGTHLELSLARASSKQGRSAARGRALTPPAD
jgi:DNA-binding transcriptional regulator PaaX